MRGHAKDMSNTEKSMLFSSYFIGNASEQPSSDRGHQKANGKNPCGVHQLGIQVGIRKKRMRKINCKGCICIPIIPFYKISD